MNTIYNSWKHTVFVLIMCNSNQFLTTATVINVELYCYKYKIQEGLAKMTARVTFMPGLARALSSPMCNKSVASNFSCCQHANPLHTHLVQHNTQYFQRVVAQTWVLVNLHGLHNCYIFSEYQVHSEVTPLMPRSSAMMTAAFSPIAIAVL